MQKLKLQKMNTTIRAILKQTIVRRLLFLSQIYLMLNLQIIAKNIGLMNIRLI